MHYRLSVVLLQSMEGLCGHHDEETTAWSTTRDMKRVMEFRIKVMIADRRLQDTGMGLEKTSRKSMKQWHMANREHNKTTEIR